MLGAVCGDIIGSRHEFNPIKTTDFDLFQESCRFTDDTVLTFAVLESLLDARDIEDCLVRWAQANIDAGYGLHFLEWTLNADRKPYGSFGNGSAMRVAPVGWLGKDLADVARLAAHTAAPTHNHHHGIRAAKAVAVAVRMALEGWDKEEIRSVIVEKFGYDLPRRTEDVRRRYGFEVASHRSVPEALICVLEADSYEETVRLAVSLGGDADTQACIAGAVAEPLFGLPSEIAAQGEVMLPKEMRELFARFRMEVSGRIWNKSDPSMIPVDLPPERDGPDPFAPENMNDLMKAEMDKLELLEKLSREPILRRGSSRHPWNPLGFLTKFLRR